MKKIITLLLSVSILTIAIGLFLVSPVINAANTKREHLIQHDFDQILPTYEDSNYVTYNELRVMINGYIQSSQNVVNMINQDIVDENIIIRIDTAQELYRFSVDVSFLESNKYESENYKLPLTVREKLLSLNYVLGNDIDYSVMKSRKFIPIGFDFTKIDSTYHHQAFTGSFNGLGFEISNLYVAGYNELILVEGQDETQIDTAITEYYSMFAYNEGIITNFGLINPTFELRTEHDDLTKAANIVGRNTGLVEKIFVRDNREPIDSGFRMRTPTGASSVNYEAAGVVFDNTQGTVKNVYYAAKTVVNQSYINSFSVQPVVYLNSGGVSQNLVYDQTVYLTSIQVGAVNFPITAANLTYQTAESTNVLKETSSLSNNFYYYPDDRYPALYGLEFDSLDNHFIIEDAYDLIYFNKMIKLTSEYQSTPYDEQNYKIVNDIHMNILSPGLFKTPDSEFKGILTGKKNGNESVYINDFELTQGVLIDNNYYVGFFSKLLGEMSNIIFPNAKITLSNTASYYNSHLYVGLVAGELNGGSVDNVLVNIELNLGSQALGSFSVGSIVGKATGTINKVYAEGNIDIGQSHTYTPQQAVSGAFYIGGIVGRGGSSKLTLHDALNKTEIKTLGTTNNINMPANELYLGGVIGYVENTNFYSNDLALLTNEGNLLLYEIKSGNNITANVGGVIGFSTGFGYELNYDFGFFTNKGLLNFTNRGSMPIVSSGVVVSNHNTANEFIFLFSSSANAFTINNFSNFKYASLVYHLGAGDVTISQSKNTSNTILTGNQVQEFSGVYQSDNVVNGLLRYVENTGNITFSNATNNTTIKIAGITTSRNTSFLNVTYSGVLAVYNINFNPNSSGTTNNYSSNNRNNENIWVSGIGYILSSGKYMKNALNSGSIYLADITSTQNVYVGGLANINESGNLQSQELDSQPKATVGIINSINDADIKSTLPVEFGYANYGFKGRGNLFIGGIVTFNGASNGGSIQDTINMGNIEVSHINSRLDSEVIADEADDNQGGRVTLFRRGIILGGVSAAITHGMSRIYDSINSGNVIAISANFARTGGILGLSLPNELTSGNVNNSLFNTSTSDNSNSIARSILSNGLNYGNISSITERIGIYSNNNMGSYVVNSNLYFFSGLTNDAFSTSVLSRESTVERIGIFASSGGVIGYGISTMKRMLNHGQISSTDVAGGVVGATVILSTFSVRIDTAINYGTVRALKQTTYNKKDIDYTQIKESFYDVKDSFIYPVTRDGHDIAYAPESKRGIGGVFGRLQRARSQYMRSSSGGIFDFVVNMDPNVDLIGRLDQVSNFESTNKFYLFENAKFYSAKLDDTTQTVFGGYYQSTNNSTKYSYHVTKDVVQQNRYEYRIQGSQVQRRVQEFRESIVETYVSASASQFVSGGTTSTAGSQVRRVRRRVVSSTWTSIGSWINVSTPLVTQYGDPFFVNPVSTNLSTSSNTSITSNRYTYMGTAVPPYISENSNITNAEYVYDPSFIMRNDNTLVDGKPITSFISFADNELLGDRFINDRLNGMYVLASSAGSLFGATLPANVNITNLYSLKDYMSYDTDYENIESENKTQLSSNIINRYLSLYQTRLNDKSQLLTDNQNIQLEEVDGLSKAFGDGTSVNNTTNIIELRMNRNQLTGTSVILKMIDALLPSKALIAARINDYDGGSYVGNPSAYRQLLLQEKDLNIANVAGPKFNITNTNNGRRSAGYFTSYSEAALDNDVFFNDPTYKTTYQVYITFYTANDAPPIYQAYINNSTSVTNNINSTSTNYNYTNTSISSALKFSFRYGSYNAGNSIISLGYDIKPFFSLEYQNGTNWVVVDPGYYTITSTPLTQSGSSASFDFNVNFKPELKGGNYRYVYKFHQNDSDRFINFSRVQSNSATIDRLAHYSQTSYIPAGTTFTTNLNFDYQGLNLNNISASSTIDTNLPVYVDNYIHSVSFLTAFKIAKFSTIDSVQLVNTIYNNGYKTYVVQYGIKAENGTITTHTHNITERPITIQNIYKDNVGANINNLTATREAYQSTFGINFAIDPTLANQIYHLDQTNPNQHFELSVTALRPDLSQMPQNEITGLTYSVTNRLNIHMSDETLPGDYTFTIRYYRDSQWTVISPDIVITKQKGTSAYLSDIRFSQTSQDTDYPDIYVSNVAGVPTTSPYIPSVYFAGIDYDDADDNNVANFRIDGTVANIPLSEYSPILIDFLPKGSTVSRKTSAYENLGFQWTPEVGQDTTNQSNIELLQTNFTLLADGSEPSDLDDVIITYRVTSEAGTSVYYHITVVDVVYNFSIVFEVYYASIAPGNHLELTQFNNETIIFDITNFHALDELGNPISIETPVTSGLPSFTTIASIESEVHMFYSAIGESVYRYRFGRNKSGFYNFKVVLPQNKFNYDIFHNGTVLDDNTEMDGKYFYIQYATKNRTRVFQVVIYDNNVPSDLWGLYDYEQIWNKMN